MYNTQPIPRRFALKIIGGGLAAGTVATVPVSARSEDLARELQTVRAATRAYRDVAVARNDGYTEVSPYTPQMGFHFVNPTLIAADEAAAVDITEPPILVYATTDDYDPDPGDDHDPDRDGDLRLAAVEFAHGGDEGPPGTPANLFSDEEASCRLKVSEEDGWEWVDGPDITALHVWVHRENPAGVFHPTNPTID